MSRTRLAKNPPGHTGRRGNPQILVRLEPALHAWVNAQAEGGASFLRRLAEKEREMQNAILSPVVTLEGYAEGTARALKVFEDAKTAAAESGDFRDKIARSRAYDEYCSAQARESKARERAKNWDEINAAAPESSGAGWTGDWRNPLDLLIEENRSR